MPVIETTSLTKRYTGRRSKAVLAVDQLSISVEQGQVYGFLGPNGSGKTTTIGMLLGIIQPTGGSIALFGASDPKGRVAARARIGATIESPNFYPYLSGRDNLRIAAAIKGVDRSRIGACLEIVGLTGRSRHRFKTYSLGMKQRLALASALLGDPELLVLDEPVNGLDPQGTRDVREIILKLAEQGKTVFVSSHLLWEIEQTCTHVAILHNGRIRAQGAVEEVLTQGTTVLVRADDDDALVAALEEFPEATKVRRASEGVFLALSTSDLSAVSRYLAKRAIYVTHLAAHRESLESVFLDLTKEEDPVSG